MTPVESLELFGILVVVVTTAVVCAAAILEPDGPTPTYRQPVTVKPKR